MVDFARPFKNRLTYQLRCASLSNRAIPRDLEDTAMMGLEEIKKANEDPLAFARSRLSDAQLRRELSTGRYWSEKPADIIASPAILHKDYGKLSVPISSCYFEGLAKLKTWIADMKLRNTLAEMLMAELADLRHASAENFEAAEREVIDTMQAMTVLLPCSNSGRIEIQQALALLEQLAPTPRAGYNPRFNLAHSLEEVKRILRQLLV